MLGDVADDRLVNVTSRTQGHSNAGGQVTGRCFVKEPLGQPAQGDAFRRQLAVQRDVLATQVLDGHAGVSEQLASVDGGAFVVLDVLQGCDDTGFSCCRCVDELDVHELGTRPQGQVVPVMAVDDVNLADRAQLPQLVPPDRDDVCVHGVVDVLLGQGAGLACGRELALCFVLEDLGCDSNVGGRHCAGLFVRRLAHARQLTLGRCCCLWRSHHFPGGFCLQALGAGDQIGLSLLQGSCSHLWRRWCLAGLLGPTVREQAQLDACVFTGLAADLRQLPGLPTLAFRIKALSQLEPKHPIDDVGLDLDVAEGVAQHVRLAALGRVGVHVQLLADVPQGPRLAAGIGAQLKAELCCCVVERRPDPLRRCLDRGLVLAGQGFCVPLAAGSWDRAGAWVDVAVVQARGPGISRQRLWCPWCWGALLRLGLQDVLGLDTGLLPHRLTTQALVRLRRERPLAGHDTRGWGGRGGWGARCCCCCWGPRGCGFNRFLHGDVSLANLDGAVQDFSQGPFCGPRHGADATEPSA